MKYIVVLGDGMADRPIQELGGRTPLQAAKKPNMDYIAAKGRCGLLRTLSDGFPLGSDVANLSILGYDPREYYSGGRGPLEAASQGIKLEKCDIALRCNLVAEDGGILTDHGGGHVSSEEAASLMAAASKAFGKKGVEFYPGVGYRNLLVLRGKYSTDVSLTPPHDIVGQRIDAHLPNQTSDAGKETAELLSNIMLASRSILGAHPVNEKRRTEGKPAANMLWFWGAGRRLELPKFKKKFGVSGALISAVDLLRGIAIYLGLEVIDVPGATGYYDTNYEGKADAAIAALSKHDFVYVHVEATDEAGHEGSVQRKVAAIEALDKRLIGRILNSLEGTKFSIAVLPDHATPVSVRTHTTDPVPFAIYSPQKEGDSVCLYDEASAARGSYGVRDGKEFMKLLFG